MFLTTPRANVLPALLFMRADILDACSQYNALFALSAAVSLACHKHCDCHARQGPGLLLQVLHAES